MHKRQNRSDIGRKCHGTHQLLPTIWTEHTLLISASVNLIKVFDFRIFLSMILSIPLQLFIDRSKFQCLEKYLSLDGDFSYMDIQDWLYQKLYLTLSST